MVAEQRGVDYDPAFLQVVSSPINDLLQSVQRHMAQPYEGEELVPEIPGSRYGLPGLRSFWGAFRPAEGERP